MTESFHILDAARVLDALSVRAEQGLAAVEARRRLAIHGANALRTSKRRGDWTILADQFKNLLTLLLAVATALSFGLGEFAEGAAIVAVIVFNGVIGFFAERKAVASIEALRRLGATMTKVRRDGAVINLAAEELVPGDIVILSAGDVVTADARLVSASGLQCDESLLTGESIPVPKSPESVSAGAIVAERSCMVFKGASVTRGSGEAVVVSTGASTELGLISKLVEEAGDEVTPLEKRLELMSRQLIWVALAIAAIVLAVGLIGGRDVVLMLKTGIALAVAAIPEGLPIVATLALSRGMWRLARRNALVERLSAVETLGAVTVIFTDKTGTLTENRMTVTELTTPGGRVQFTDSAADLRSVDPGLADRAAHVLALCVSAELRGGKSATDIGDPMERALVQAADKMRVAITAREQVGEEAFDPQSRMMAALHRSDAGLLITVKGAPEAVLERVDFIAHGAGDRPIIDADRAEWLERTRELAAEGRRVLALADRSAPTADGDPYRGLSFLGLVALEDPPRHDARAAVKAAQRAGIRVVMITGDNAVTGAAIARAVGLTDDADVAVVEGRELRGPDEMSDEEKRRYLETRVFARVSPEQKLDLITLYQQAGEIVAMTGDGVNDAPALKKADIGVAMGLRGTQIAREASDIVLKDDAFASIIAAVRQGRVIFGNIRSFVFYLMSCNISEVLVVAIGVASNLPLPLLPLQILFLNLVTDVFPALALGAGGGDKSVLSRPPRPPGGAIMSSRRWIAAAAYSTTIAAAVLGAFVWALGRSEQGPDYAATIAFLTLALAQMWHVFNMRSRYSGLVRNEIVRNPYVWAALAICGLLLLSALYVAPVAQVLRLVDPGLEGWIVILTASLLPLVGGQVFKVAPRQVYAPLRTEGKREKDEFER